MGKEDTDIVEDAAVVSPAEAQAAFRLAASLILALALGGPGLLQVLTHEREFIGAAWWFLLSFVAARVAVGVVWAVWASYRRSIDEHRTVGQREQLALEMDRRRADLLRGRASATVEDIAG